MSYSTLVMMNTDHYRSLRLPGVCAYPESALTSEDKILSPTLRLEEKAIFQGAHTSFACLSFT